MSSKQNICPPKDLLEKISKKYVQKDFQKRFITESLKKPNKLTYRICHHIDSVFHQYEINEKNLQLDSTSSYWMLSGNWSHGSWTEFETRRGSGAGLMIFPDDGRFLYAEEEI